MLCHCGSRGRRYSGLVQARPRASLPADAAITAVAALQDELRHGMYEFIRAAPDPVTREEAAAAVGISRKLAAFHLDKLVTAGLLRKDDATVARLRKVGRAPKVYSPVDADIRVSIPERQYDVLAGILIAAVLTEDRGETAPQAVMRAAQDRGRTVGMTQRQQLRAGRLGAERALTAAEILLQRHGYEPDRVAAARVCLRNCPFHPLAEQAPELVCGANHAFLTGFLHGLDAPTVEAVLEPRTGKCCVELRAVARG
jgi:predicted ArsR family transcriptional regulator